MTDDYTALLGEVESYSPPYANESTVDYASTFTPVEAGPQDTRSLSEILGLKYTSPTKPARGPNPGIQAPDDIFSRVVQAESRGRHLGPNGKLLTSSAGAQGITQIMPETGKRPGYGIKPLQDSSEAEYLRVGGELLDAYTKSFGGDTAKGLAAYNFGPANVQKLIRKHGDNWRQALPKETSDYLNKIIGVQNA